MRQLSDHITKERKQQHLVGVEKGSVVAWRWGTGHRVFQMVMANGSVKECKLGERHLLCLRVVENS